MYKNKEQNNVFSEGYILNGKDFKYKVDDFESGKTNILFITGASGSGKSTTAKGLAKKYSCEYIELDDVINADSFSDDNLKEYNPIMYGFFTSNPTGKKFRHISLKEGVDENDYWEIIPAFLKYAVQHTGGKKYIIEGIEIYDCVDAGKLQPAMFKPYAMIIKDTSALKSAVQAIDRDIKNDNAEEKGFELIKYIFSDMKVRAHTYRFVRSGTNKIKKELKKG
jgi:dephospho-CoA kinase